MTEQPQLQPLDSSRLKPVLKKQYSLFNQCQRYDRKGQQIRLGTKYEITISPEVQYFHIEIDEPKANVISRTPRVLESETDQVTETSNTKRPTSADAKEKAFLGMLDKQLVSRRKKKKQCCVIC